MIGTEGILQLQEMDLAHAELGDPKNVVRLRRIGFPEPEMALLERARDRLLATMDRRWVNHYQRARDRYGRGVAVVRDRVCQGCHITLPTCAAPSGDDPLTLCESCGRILYWR
jgi:predicted  nucleic acid-binding Zn-ribbon protein